MNIDWGTASDIATVIIALPTSLGVLFMAWQIFLMKRQSQATFEDKLDEQYRLLAKEIPVQVLLGKPILEEKKGEVTELLYNYFDLTNEQISYRTAGLISGATWASWCAGIRSLMAYEAFAEVYETVNKDVNGDVKFSYLERLIVERYKTDPLDWQSETSWIAGAFR